MTIADLLPAGYEEDYRRLVEKAKSGNKEDYNAVISSSNAWIEAAAKLGKSFPKFKPLP